MCIRDRRCTSLVPSTRAPTRAAFAHHSIDHQNVRRSGGLFRNFYVGNIRHLSCSAVHPMYIRRSRELRPEAIPPVLELRVVAYAPHEAIPPVVHLPAVHLPLRRRRRGRTAATAAASAGAHPRERGAAHGALWRLPRALAQDVLQAGPVEGVPQGVRRIGHSGVSAKASVQRAHDSST